MRTLSKVSRIWFLKGGQRSKRLGAFGLDTMQAWGKGFEPRKALNPHIYGGYMHLRSKPYITFPREQYDPTRVSTRETKSWNARRPSAKCRQGYSSMNCTPSPQYLAKIFPHQLDTRLILACNDHVSSHTLDSLPAGLDNINSPFSTIHCDQLLGMDSVGESRQQYTTTIEVARVDVALQCKLASSEDIMRMFSTAAPSLLSAYSDAPRISHA